jgi:hypothetical protein
MIIWITVGILVLLLIIVFSYYNRFIVLGNRIDNSLSQINVQLKRRADLIPNLIETVKGYAKHEKAVLKEVSDARKALVSAKGIEDKVKADKGLEGALGKLFANKMFLLFSLMFMFVFFLTPGTFSQEIVSDVYEVDSYNLGVGGGEDFDNESRSIILAESGAIFVQNEYGGEEYRYPEDVLIVQEPDFGGGGGSGGAGASAGSAGGGCFNSEDCGAGLHCLNGICLRLFNISIIKINSPILKNESFELVYEIEVLFEPQENIAIQGFLIGDENEILSFDEENINLKQNSKENLIFEIPVPEKINSGPYNFTLRAIHLNLSQSESRNYFLTVRDDSIEVGKKYDWDLILAISILSLFFIGGLVYLILYYRKNKDTIIFNFVSFFSNVYEKIKIGWRRFILWIKEKF